LVQLFLAAVLAYEIAFIQAFRSPGGWIAFLLVMASFLAADSFAFGKGAGAWKRVGLTAGLAVLIIAGNSATTLTRCDRQHHCHRVFS